MSSDTHFEEPLERIRNRLKELGGFPDSMSVIAAHIHNAPAGVNAGIFIGLVGVFPVVESDGLWQFSATVHLLSAAAVQNLLANPAAFYFNVHSAVNPGGVARGQLFRAA